MFKKLHEVINSFLDSIDESTIKKILIIIIIVDTLCILLFLFQRCLPTSVKQEVSAVPPIVSPLSTEVTIVPKEKPQDPDLVIDNKYVAVINDKQYSLPLKENTEVKDNVVIVKQEVDVSPLVPKWEIGVGLGVHKSSVYVPLSIQRNYELNKGIEVELQVNTEGLRGVSVQHKWLF